MSGRPYFLSGMPEEDQIVASVFPGLPRGTGTAKLHLPTLVPPGTTRIIVTGLFGGLAPGIPVGSICAAKTIVDKAKSIYICDVAWNARVATMGLAAGMTFGVVPWYSSGLLDEADSASQRAAIFAKYGTKAIDDEVRYAVAEAERRGIPCTDLRSCSDDWTETLPLPATGAIMNADGSADIPFLIGSLWKDPKQIPMLTKIGEDFATSLDTLKTALYATKEAILT